MLEFALTCLLVYLGIGIGLHLLFERFVFMPMPPGGDLYRIDSVLGVPKRELFFPGKQGERLNAWYFKTPDAPAVVLVNHGNAGNLGHRLFMAKNLIQLGYSVFLYDYRGYGLSQGRPSSQGIIEDGLAAYDYVSGELGYKPEEIVIYGESIGSAVSCRVAKARGCAALIMQSPFLSLPIVARDNVFWLRLYPTWVFPQPHLSNLDCVQEPHPPLLILHGEEDTMVPLSHARLLFQRAQEPKRLVTFPHAGHNTIGDADRERYLSSVGTFLKSALPAAAERPEQSR